MKVFVTGASGFIGKIFCRLAMEGGHEVLGLIRSTEATLPMGCQRVVGSLEEMPWKEIEQFQPETALHLAWTTAPGLHFHSPLNGMLIKQSGALFRGLVIRGVKHVAGTGTFIEYTTSKAPLMEDGSPLAPLYPYSQAKVETFENLRKIGEAENVSWSWFRVFNAFGEGENKARMISSTMLSLASGQVAELKTPDSVRDYIHVTDVAMGMIRALEQKQTGPVNIGSGTGISVLELACEIATAVGASPTLIHPLNPPSLDLMPVAIANNAKLRSTGWSQQVSLREGLHQLWNSLKFETKLS